MGHRGPEREIEFQILVWLKNAGFDPWKLDRIGTYDVKKRAFRRNTNPFKKKGLTDIWCFMFGRLVCVEVKSKTGKTTHEQRAFMVHVNECGHVAFVSRSLVSFLNEIVKHFPQYPEFQTLVHSYLLAPDDKH